MAKLIALGVIVVAIGSTAWFYWPRPQPPLHEGKVTLPDGSSVMAEVADTDASRTAGLSGRPDLPDGKGMLFQFDAPGMYPFWMRGMRFPIDMVWIMDDHVVWIRSNVSAAPADQLNIHSSADSANRVLELPANYAQAHGVTIGATLDIQLPTR